MLEVKDATITVGGHTLAEGLSFIANDGQLTCITGPQGSGKTVLLRTLMGFLPVARGFVSVDGELLTILSASAFRTMMVYLPQQIQMLSRQLTPPEAPVAEADAYGVWNALLPPASRAEQAEPLLPGDIYRLAEKTLAESADKQIVIADEPAAQLPSDLSERMLRLLRSQAEQGKTVLIASKHPLLVGSADKVIEMKGKEQ